MPFEETIQYLFDHYPQLFTERWQVLNHLFCVIGNGYGWVDGAIVSKDPERVTTYKHQLGADGKAQLHLKKAKTSMNDWFTQIFPTEYLEKETKRKQVLQQLHRMPETTLQEYLTEGNAHTIGELMEKLFPFPSIEQEVEQHFAPKTIEFYPLLSTSLLLNVPTNVQDDWKNGAKETAQLLLAYTPNLSEEKKIVLQHILCL